MYKLR
jgi:hypothetical protein